jgi:hypothetical protein
VIRRFMFALSASPYEGRCEAACLAHRQRGRLVFLCRSSAFACQSASLQASEMELGERLLKLSDL